MTSTVNAGTAVPRTGDARLERRQLGDFFRYHGIWAPGVRLFRRLPFRAKAALISLGFLVPILALAWPFFANQASTLALSAGERSGLVYLGEVHKAIVLAQRHRVLALEAVAKGSAPEGWDALNTALDAQMKTLAEVDAGSGEQFSTASDLAAVQKTHQALAAVASSADQVFSSHAAHLSALLVLGNQVSDGSKLTSDPDMDINHLVDALVARMPDLTEQIEQLRLLGAPALSMGDANPTLQRQLAELVALSGYQERALFNALKQVSDLRPEFKASISTDELAKTLASFKALSLNGEQFTAGIPGNGKSYIDAGRKLSESLDSLRPALTSSLDALLSGREAGIQRQRTIATAGLVLSIGLSMYLFYSFSLVLAGGLREVRNHLERMTRGDLTGSPRPWGKDEAADLMTSLADMQASLRAIVSNVRQSSDVLVHSCSDISQGAMDLSVRTEHAASALEESASAMEQLGSTVRQTAHNTQEAARAATDNTTVAQRGGVVIREVVATMQDIHAASSKISEIIGTIDGIAFQTNILALNAAVEAARAGEQGRGFAVVASEVRSLAQRSASAAREIKDLINGSVDRVESGTRAVQGAGVTMDEIVANARKMNELLSGIAVSTSEQSAGVTQVSTSVQELDRGTQQNSALVEKTAAASNSLKSQALLLAEEVKKFRLPATV
ncbi:MAG: methyl-accepting chemotaxis protein [Rhizobacter sp.]